MSYARCITRFLQVHPKVDHIDNDLSVTLGLHVAPHQAESEPRLAVGRAGVDDDPHRLAELDALLADDHAQASAGAGGTGRDAV